MELEKGEDKKSTLPRTSFEVPIGVRYIGTKNNMIKESGIPRQENRFLDHCEKSCLRTTTGTIENKDSVEGVSK